jgi:DNA-binding protein YbaB
MSQDNATEVTFESLRAKLPQLLAKDASPPVTISVDGIVAIEVDAQFNVNSVAIQGIGLQPDQTTRLQQALVKAINQANQEVAKRNAARIMQSIGTAG